MGIGKAREPIVGNMTTRVVANDCLPEKLTSKNRCFRAEIIVGNKRPKAATIIRSLII